MNPDPSIGDQLAEELSILLARVDPVPRQVRDAASASLSWRNIDAELAVLTSTGPRLADLAGVRGEPPRLLSFETPTLCIDVEIAAEAGGVRLLGQLAPGQPARVTIELARGGRVETEADELGRFAASGLPTGWLRLSVRSAGESADTCTEWFQS